MDPTTTCCPNLACPASGQVGQGNISSHSRQHKRFVCTQCHRTFTDTEGTAFYRLRTPADTVTRVLTLLAHVAEVRPVLCVGEDLVLATPAAARLLEGVSQGLLWERARGGMGT